MHERKNYQDYLEGREGVTELFHVEDKSGNITLGLECGGVISYFYPDFHTCTRGLIILHCDYLAGIFNKLYDLSEPRLEALAKYCPLLVQSAKDGAESRYDRGAIVNVDGKYAIVKWRSLDIKKHLGGEMDLSFMYDSLQIDLVVELIHRCNQMVDELEKWDGFTSLEELKITAQEVLPGASMGFRIGRLLSGL